MDDDERLEALDAAIEQLLEAVLNAGPRPEVHREVMDRHRAEWPTLWAAIDAVLAAGSIG